MRKIGDQDKKKKVIHNWNHKYGYFHDTPHLTDIDPRLILIIGPVAHSKPQFILDISSV